MLTSTTVKQALKRDIPSHIYSRGASYYRSGAVRTWGSQNDKTGQILTIAGDVQGSERYQVILQWDMDAEKFSELDCTCPYGSACKHCVSLGLAFADSLEKKQKNIAAVIDVWPVEKNPTLIIDTDALRIQEALRGLGLTTDAMPKELIEQLLQYRTAPLVVKPPKQSPHNTRPTPFHPEDYYITLNKYNRYIPQLHQKRGLPYQQPNIKKILSRDDLTDSQRKLLNTVNRVQNPATLFPLLVASAFPVYNHYYSYNQKPIVIDLHPPILKAEIVYQPVPLYGDPTIIRHDFLLCMPKEYWEERNTWDGQPFTFYHGCLVHESDDTIALHTMTPLLSRIIARVQPTYDDGRGYQRIGPRAIRSYETRLTGEEVAQFGAVCAEAAGTLTLTAPPPPFTTQESGVCQRSIVVDFNADEQTLRVIPVIDYGFCRQDISENIYMSRRTSGDRLVRRAPFEHPDSHLIVVNNPTIHYAKVNEREEIGFYRDLAKQAESLGFTKTLKCQKQGNRAITEYLRSSWPTLLAYAQSQQYPILFTKDSLALTQEPFRAEFTTDLDAQNDWLYFDVACYCGEERVTLEQLIAYLESGAPFWRRSDGTLVEISNREELERLARLLLNFHAREQGGFEGQLHHAAELEYVMTSSPHYNAVRAKSFQAFLSETKSGKPVKPQRLPKRFSTVLREYQKAGVDWLYFLRSYRFAGILADDMGLGKTLQALVLLSKEQVPGRPSLVVCPKTLLYNWKLETEKFAPELKVLVMEGLPAERSVMRGQLPEYDLVVMSYSTLKQDEDALINSGMRFNYAVLDEAQFIKNHASKTAQIVKKLSADYRLALTGTPLENSVSELWSIFDFLMPGFLGRYEHFAKHFHKPIMDAGDQNVLNHLREKVKYFMLRRSKTEVLKELPAKIEQVSECHLTTDQSILYQQILAKVRGEVFSAVEQRGFRSAQIHILAGLMKLRQACNHPALLTKQKDWRMHKSAKLDMCLELVKEVMESKRKVLIFSQFTQMLDIISEALDDTAIKHVYLSGKTQHRQQLVDSFQSDPTVSVFLLSLKAGGTGLNLTAADTVIIIDPWWNPSVEHQAIDRTHRIGQKKTVNVYRLLTKGTIEEKIQALKAKKQRLFDAMVNESGDQFNKLTWDDVQELFKE